MKKKIANNQLFYILKFRYPTLKKMSKQKLKGKMKK